MNVGFTGSRKGMTDSQKYVVRTLLEKFAREDGVPVFHNGLAIGADHEAALIAKELGYYVLGYPSDKPEHTCDFIPDYYAQEPKPPLDRNPDIVRASEVMIATPNELREIKRSGTWATMRETKRQGKELWIVYRGGSTAKSF